MSLRVFMEDTFGPSGHLENIDPIRYQHRPAQYEFALALGDRYDNLVPATHAEIQLAEVGTGVGKTLPYLMALSFLRSVSEGPRGLIATYTRALRDDITKEISTVNAVLKRYNLGPITIASLQSITAIASLEEAEAIVKYFEQHDPTSVYRQKAEAYRDAIKAVEEDPISPGVFYLSDWLDSGEDFDFVTVGRGGTAADKLLGNLSIRHLEYKNKVASHPGFTAFDATQRDAKYNADIVVVTHTMFILNGLLLGGILNTNAKPIKIVSKENQFDIETFPRKIEPTLNAFHVVIDEADQFTHQSSTFFNTSFTIQSIRDLYLDAGLLVPRSISALVTVLDQMNFIVGTSKNFLVASDEGLMVAPLCKVFEGVVNTFVINDTYRGTLHTDRAAILAESMRKIIEYHSVRGGTSLVAAQYSFANIELSITKLPYANGKPDYQFSFVATKGWHLVSRSWRNFNTHAFKSFLLLSGTLLDEKKSSETFRKMVGIGSNDNVSSTEIVIPTTGIAKRIVFCEGPPTPWGDEIEALQSENNQATRAMSVAYGDHLLEIVKAAAEVPTLVLVTSYSRLEFLRGNLSGNFVIQNRGERSSDFVKRIVESEKPVSAICLFWSGVNFVNKGVTLFDRVLIPLLPFSPLATVHDGWGVLRRNKTEAYWKIKQGLGRIFRHPVNDLAGEIWIGDPRLGMNNRYAGALSPYRGGKHVFPPLFDDIQRLSPDQPATELCIWNKEIIMRKSL